VSGEPTVSAGVAPDGASSPAGLVAAVVVAWDGALVDSAEAVCAALSASAAEVVGEAFPASASDRAMVVQLGEPQSLRLLTEEPTVLDELEARFLEHYAAPDGPKPEIRPGGRAFLDQLRALDHRMVLLSMGHADRVRLDLQRLEIGHLFDLVLTADDVDDGPPSPAGLELATARLGLPPTQVVFVGGSVEDLIGGRAAGLRVAAVDHLDEPARFGDDQPWLVVSSFGELSRRLAATLDVPSEP
jgi:beta-phosphoglucomutase-like phosphatase (HAD superfamily)